MDAVKLLAVEVLNALEQRGGTARVSQIAQGRNARRRVKAALQMAARERLVTSRDGETYTLTEKARVAISSSKAAA